MMRCLGMTVLAVGFAVLTGCDGGSAAPSPGERRAFDLRNGVQLEMVYIAPGTFRMGSPPAEVGRDDDEEQHPVTLTRGYWLGKYEVTQAQWEAVMGSGSNPSKSKGENQPVERVSWYDCREFIGRLNQMLAGEGGGFRLPTEAEWEYACRAGNTARFCYGDDPESGRLYEYAWFQRHGRKATRYVGTLQPNAWGLHDMHGNVWEWCEDRYGPYPSSAVNDPLGAPPQNIAGGEDTAAASREPDRVYRGGSYSDCATSCRSANRGGADPCTWDERSGFRLARTDIARRKAAER